MMKLVGKFLVIGLIAMMFAVPVMACLLPNAALSPQEKACCREMAGQCGDMGMSSSHSCCKSTVGNTALFITTSHTAVEYDFNAVSLVVSGPVVIQPQLVSPIGGLAQTHSPPVPFSENTSILRI